MWYVVIETPNKAPVRKPLPPGLTAFGRASNNVIGIAINSGLAMVGYVGAADRTEFNVLGDVVNVACRLQEDARPYKIIVGPETVAALDDNYKHRRVGAMYIRGREKSVQAHEVLFH